MSRLPESLMALADVLEEALLFDPCDYDAAIVGCVENSKGEKVVAYDYEKLAEITALICGASPGTPGWEDACEEAMQHVDYNMVRGAMYMQNKRGPVVLAKVQDEQALLEADEDDPTVIVELAGERWTYA